MAERRRGGGSGNKDQQIRQLTRQLEEANERADSLKQRLEREKGPIDVTADTAVTFDAASGTLTIGAHPAEQAFAGSQTGWPTWSRRRRPHQSRSPSRRSEATCARRP
jgi:hypothetical protein